MANDAFGVDVYAWKIRKGKPHYFLIFGVSNISQPQL